MSSIEKLSIRGIRSFSPNREEIIEFYHPLTVILGDNGSGKTTIIECLKIACTGALPPGARSGQSFVHDPRIAGTNEVKGSVRLRFRNRAGKPMVVQRTFQLQQQKNSAKFKALDGAIRTQNEVGESVSMSQKCAELDRHIPDMLGVSKAILESVIFCHQEESNWPLQEGAVLKKRFDDIFESARYTKALDAIRKLKKARGDNAKDFKRDLSILSMKLKAAEEIKQKIEAAEAQQEEATEEANKLEQNIDAAEETRGDLQQLLKDIKAEHAELSRMQTDAVQKELAIQSAHQKMKNVMSDTDEELKELLSKFDLIVDDLDRKLQEHENEVSQSDKVRKDAQEELNKLSTEKGKLESMIEAHHKMVTDFLDRCVKAGTNYQFYSMPISSQDDGIKSFLNKFQQYVGDKSRIAAEFEAQVRQQEDELNAIVTDLNAKLHHAKEQRKVKQGDRKTLNEEKRQNITKLKELTANSVPSTHDVSEAEKLVTAAQDALQVFKDQHHTFSLKDEIETIQKAISDVNFDIGRDSKTIEILRGSERDYMSLEAKRQTLREKQDDFREQLADKAAEYRTIIADDAPQDEGALSSIVERLSDILSNKRTALTDKKTQAHGADQSVQENLAFSKHVQKTLTDLRNEKNKLERGPVGELRRLVEEISPGDDLGNAEDVVRMAEKAYFEAKDKTLRCKNTVTFLRIFKEKGIKDKCCPLCVREMSTADEELFIRTINEKTDDNKVKDKIRRAEAAELAALGKWKGIESKLPEWRKWKQIEDKITKESKELDSLYVAKRTMQSEANEKSQQAEKAQLEVDEVQKALRAFSSLVGVAQELQKLHTKIASEEERLRSQDVELLGANAPSLATVQASRDEKQNRLQDLYQQLALKQGELQRIHELQQKLQTDLHKKREEKARIEEERKVYDAAVAEKVKLGERMKALEDEIAMLSSTEFDLDTKYRTKTEELTLYRAEASIKLKKAQQEQQQLKKELESIQDMRKKIEHEAGQNLEVVLKKLNNSIAQLKQKSIEAEQKLADIGPRIESVRKRLGDQENLKREIQDNLDLRKLQKELEQIRAYINEAKHKISSLPSLDDVSRRLQGAIDNVDGAKEARATLRGRQQQLESQIREEKVKLRSADYRNIEEKHRQKLIQFETTMMAVSDLDKYYKALDNSLLQFHSKKVEEINSIIKSLWQITYKGQDIDTIEVVSGQELDTGGSKASRSYDYRVVMKKGGALIDMRGRCSAGQKVLAALVIRLALAETFCLNCGILALDEPTTNLDTENKYGLAQAITDILNARSAQQNFQLVCITHDEEFVQMLSEAQAMDGTRPEFYWRVSREDIGNNRFCSKIERREWRDGI